ncbi:MAG: phage terminase large subunit, partial [Planctomycetota bacterium]
PSMGRDPTRGDHSAIVVIARHARTRVDYVLAADIKRRNPADAIERLLQYTQMYQVQSVVIEDNGFQQLLKEQVKSAAAGMGLRVYVTGVKNSANKHARIQLLEPVVMQGKLRFNRAHTVLLEQLRQFPLAAHDDGPDALEMAVSYRPRRPRITTVSY